jgi:endonuclease/exonuclease/phosphatase (EEP) superfamily protein YafD
MEIEAAQPTAPPEGEAPAADDGTGGSSPATVVDRRETAPAALRRRSQWRTANGITRWTLAAGFVAFAIMRMFGLERTWYLNMLVAFTPYVALLSILFIPVTILLRRWWATGIATAAAAVFVSVLVPLAVGRPDPGPGPELHVMSSNMKIGAADPASIVALVRLHRTDVLTLDEYTPEAQHGLAAAGLGGLLPYHAQTPIPGATGSAIFSRYPLNDAGYRPLAGGFGQEYATVLVPGALPLVVEAVHARAPADPADNADWAKSLTQEPAATRNGAVRLLIGDFNATLDHHRLRTLLDTGYRDIAAQLGDGLETTWPYDGSRSRRSC